MHDKAKELEIEITPANNDAEELVLVPRKALICMNKDAMSKTNNIEINNDIDSDYEEEFEDNVSIGINDSIVEEPSRELNEDNCMIN